MNRPITVYYLLTIVFVVLDFFIGINIRAAFLDPYPLGRAAYYLFCFACLAVMLWRPGWAVVVGTVESLICVVALILAVGLRVMVVSEETIEAGSGFITPQEIVNFLLVDGIAYFAYMQGMSRIKREIRR